MVFVVYHRRTSNPPETLASIDYRRLEDKENLATSPVIFLAFPNPTMGVGMQKEAGIGLHWPLPQSLIIEPTLATLRERRFGEVGCVIVYREVIWLAALEFWVWAESYIFYSTFHHKLRRFN